MRLQGLAGFLGVLAAVVALFVPGTSAAAGREGARTPVAREGSPLASHKRISEGHLKSILQREMNSVGGSSGAYVYDVDANSDRLLFSDSASGTRILASNTKLFTTAAYLDRFGPDGRLETRVFERGKRTGGRERTLKGSIVLVGDGDPALAEPSYAHAHNKPLTRLDSLAKAVKDAGIRTVKGNVLADPTIFDGATGAPHPGVTPGPGDTPTLSGLSFNSGFEGGGYAQNPARNAGEELVRELRDRGVRVTGNVKVGGAPSSVLDGEPLGSVMSPAARSLIAQTNTPSDNFYAEMLLKRLGTGPQGKQGTTKRGASRAENFAKKAGSAVNMVNGSGLARTDKASAKNVTRLLVHMRSDQSLKGAYYDSLAVAGKTGTLAGRMRNTAAEGRCHAKTGTINGVSALSGYCRAGAGQVAFSFLMNGVSTSEAQRAQDAMAAAIARYR